MAAGVKTGGRKAGTPNKTTQAAKECIAEAFESLGSTKGLVSWAQSSPDNQKAFYTQIWPKIVPLQLTGDPNAPIAVQMIELVGVPSDQSTD